MVSLPLDKHFDWVADNDRVPRRRQSGFHAQLRGIFRHHIPEGSRVLEVGCGAGNLLRALKPSRGLGIDISPRMIARATEASKGQPGLEFRVGDIQKTAIEEKFDYIVLDYLAGYLQDIQAALQNLRKAAHPRTRLILTSLNSVWRPVLKAGQVIGWVMPQPPSNWLSTSDLINLLEISGWEIVVTSHEQLFPFNFPVVSPFFNRFLARMPIFGHMGATLLVVARPIAQPALEGPVSCSVVVPARNESGNIRAALDRIPVLGRQTEVIFVEGNSKDDTWEVIQREVAAYKGPHKLKALKQPGKGKWDAVRTGMDVATGDVVVVQDADLTAPPEDLPKFYDLVVSGKAEFANGCRLVYPMEKTAMRFLNLLGNKFFAMALTFVLRQPLKDSLCGTKMMLRSDYVRAIRRVSELGDFDPFGDFNMLFGSALIDLRIREVPVRYLGRTYGETNISRFRHGALLLKMTAFGLWNLRCFK